ncbi:MAG: hypothetical protein BM561_00315 [Vibrio sp. MedPE-SWchi]|nr:MAG: hypothetical protein BM561_00315 [Vibrio sp. MedPE-SWchi]
MGIGTLIGGNLAAGQIIVIDVNGNIKIINEGDQVLPGEVIVKNDGTLDTQPDQGLQVELVGEEGELQDISGEIEDIFAALEEGQDPTQLGEDFATAAGGNSGSSLTASGSVTRDGSETIAQTNFDTQGLENLGLSQTQSLTLLQQFRQFAPNFVNASLAALGDGVDVTTDEDTTLTGQLAATDANGDDLTYSQTSAAENGSVTVNPDGSWEYIPNENYNGADSFTVQVSDGQGGLDTLTINISVTPVNDDPTFVDESNALLVGNIEVTTKEDEATSGNVQATDVDGDDLTYAVLTQGENGIVTVDADGNWEYTPNEEYNGSDTFDIQVSDGQGGFDTVTVDVTVLAVAEMSVTAGEAAIEGDESYLSFTINLDQAVSEDVFLSLTLEADGDSATKGSDYLKDLFVSNGEGGYRAITEQDLTIPSGDTELVVYVQLKDDYLYEVSESISLLATSKSDFLENTEASATGLVTDEVEFGAEDTVYAQIEVNDDSVQEGESLTYTVTLVDSKGNVIDDLPRGTDIEVALDWSGKASRGDDTSDLPESISIGRSGTAEFTVDATDDFLAEGSEKLNVRITEVTDEGGSFEAVAVSTSRSTAESKIVDEDIPDVVTVGLTGPSEVKEGEQTNEFTVSLGEKAPAGSIVTLSYTYVTAQGEDIQEQRTAVVNSDGLTANFAIDTNDDDEHDPDETFVVSVEAIQFEGKDVFEEINVSKASQEVTINDSTDNPPKSEDFTQQVLSSGKSYVVFDTGTGTIAGVGTDHISDKEDDLNDNANLQVVITELPEHGTLWYNDVKIEKADLYTGDGDGKIPENVPRYDPNLIQYQPDNDSEGFILGVKEAQLDEAGSNNKEFLNWGEATGNGNERVLDLGGDKQVTISSKGGNLIQYMGDPNADHVGYGIGVKNDGGINKNETISIDFNDRPADSVTFGLDGLGGWFDENLNDKNESSVQIIVHYQGGPAEGVEYTYQKSTQGDSNLFHEITIPVSADSDNGTLIAVDGSLPEGALITSVDLSTIGNGNWELRYIETEATDSFDYRAVDSDGNVSDESTVTIDESNGALDAVNDPKAFSVELGTFNENSWNVEGANISASYQDDPQTITEDGVKRGVGGHENGGIAAQIQYNRDDAESEQFIIDLDQPATEFSFTVSNLFKGEGDNPANHEQGRWTAYLDGVAVASDTFVANEGHNKGSYNIELGESDSPIAFDSIVFESTEFADVPAKGNDSSDYFLTGFKASSEGAYAVNQGGILEIPASQLGLGSELLDNDSDADGDPIRITYVYGESEGDAYVKDGIVYFDFTGDAFTGETTFQYQITDDRGNVANATVNVIVNPTPSESTVDSVALVESTVPEGNDLAFKVSLDSSALVETKLKLTFGSDSDTASDEEETTDVDLSKLVFTNGVKFESGELIVPVGVKDFTILIPTETDGLHEGDETYTIKVGEETATGTIQDADNLDLSVTSLGDVSEGSVATFEVSIGKPSVKEVTLSLAVNTDGAQNTAEAEDFAAPTFNAYYVANENGVDVNKPLEVTVENGKPVVTVPGGLAITSIFVNVATDSDEVYEGGEQFELVVSEIEFIEDTAKDNATIFDDGSMDPDGDGPLNADDDRPMVESISNIDIQEGEVGTFTVELSNASTTDTVVLLSLIDGSATSNSSDPSKGDYNASSVTITFSNGDSQVVQEVEVQDGKFNVTVPSGFDSFSVGVATNQDSHTDSLEHFILTGKTTAQQSDESGTAIITDNEAPIVDLNGSQYDVEFVSETAGYSSIFGYYIFDEKSNTHELRTLITNTNDQSEGSLLDSPFTQIDNVEFFLIPDGYDLLETDDLFNLSMNNEGELLVNGTVQEGVNVFTTLDDDSQVRRTINDDGDLILSFDDQRGNGRDDNDYNDLVIKVTNIDKPTGFVSEYTEGEDPVHIADTDADIFDDKDVVKSMTIELTNKADGDSFINIPGTAELPAIDGLVFEVSAGETIITVSSEFGNGVSAKLFEDFLTQVQFTNSSDTPNTADRVIHVSVIDGAGQPSNTATTSIRVIPVADITVSGQSIGAEDSLIELDIDIPSGSAITQLEVSEIPPGTELYVDGQKVIVTDGKAVFGADSTTKVEVKPAEDSDVDFALKVQGLDAGNGIVERSHDVNVVVNPIADKPSLFVTDPTVLSFNNFEQVDLSGRSWRGNVSNDELNDEGSTGKWLADSDTGRGEVGKEGVYLGGGDQNQLFELEGGRRDNTLSTEFEAKAGNFYSISFDISSRRVGSSPAKLFLVSEAGERTEIFDYDKIEGGQAIGWSKEKVTFETPEEGTYTLVFESNQTDTYGALLDNIELTTADNYGYEDSFINISDLVVGASKDTDGSEELTVLLEGLPEGTIVRTAGEDDIIVGEDGIADISNWDDLVNLQIKFTEPSPEDEPYPVTVTVTSSETDSNFPNETSSVSETINVTVREVSDVTPIPTPNPDAESRSILADEDEAINLSLSDFGITDVDTTITFTHLGNGEIQIKSGDVWITLNDNEVSSAEVNAGNVRFKPAEDESADDSFPDNSEVGDQHKDYAKFDFVVSKDGSSSEVKTLTVDVTPVADAPDVSIFVGDPTLISNVPDHLMSGTDYESWDSISNAYNKETLDDDVNTHYDASTTAIRGLGNADVITAASGKDHILVGDDGVLGNSDGDNVGQVNDTLYGSIGNDVLIGEQGNDGLYGDRGIDTAVYAGKFEDYSITKPTLSAGNVLYFEVKDNQTNDNPYGGEGLDGLYSIERLQFSDGTYFYQDNEWVKEESFTSLSLELTVSLTDIDGSESLKDNAIKLTGIPDGITLMIEGEEVTDFTLSNGIKTFSIPVTLDDNYSASIDNASLNVPSDFTGSLDFNVSATAISVEESNGSESLGQDENIIRLNDESSFDILSSGDDVRDTVKVKTQGQSETLQWSHTGSGGTVHGILGKDNAELINVGDAGDKVESGQGDDVIFLGDSDRDTPQAGSQAEREFNRFISGLDSEHVKDDTEFNGNSGSNSSIDYAHSGSGNDTVYGEGGIDAIFGGTGDDKLYGGEGTDGLRGGSGDDLLSGGEGNDVLIGGEGNDLLIGGEGEDLFKWVDDSYSNHQDVITDFKFGEDYIDLSELVSGNSTDEMESFLSNIVVEVEGAGDDADIKLTLTDGEDNTQEIILQDVGAQSPFGDFIESQSPDNISLLNDIVKLNID